MYGLPLRLVLKIISYLPPRDFYALSRTSKFLESATSLLADSLKIQYMKVTFTFTAPNHIRYVTCPWGALMNIRHPIPFIKTVTHYYDGRVEVNSAPSTIALYKRAWITFKTIDALWCEGYLFVVDVCLSCGDYCKIKHSCGMCYICCKCAGRTLKFHC